MDFDLKAAAALRPDRDIYTVSRLNREVRVLLERGFGTLWLEAEISNLAKPSSGHWYFSLKDAAAQVRCAMFRQRNMLCAFGARDGQKVLVRARIGLYEPRGEYQLIIDHMEDAGWGALKRQFEELSAKLAAEGLFAADRKRPLPKLPSRIGIVTSPTGAAVRDILHVLARRFPAARRTHLSGSGSRRPGSGRHRRGTRPGGPPRRMRRADPGSRRRLPGGSLGVQRRTSGARHRRLAHTHHHGDRSRGRFHHCRFRSRCARADAVGGRGTGRSRCRGMARGSSGACTRACSAACNTGSRSAASAWVG